MLGRQIADPDSVESGGVAEGFGFLSVTTILKRDKITEQVQAHALHLTEAAAQPVQGYLIHMGRTDRRGHQPCFQLKGAAPYTGSDSGVGEQGQELLDGAVRDDSLVWGTYIHGLFDQPGFRRTWLNRLRIRKGLPALDPACSRRVSERRQDALDRWADHVEGHLDLTPILELLRGEGRA